MGQLLTSVMNTRSSPDAVAVAVIMWPRMVDEENAQALTLTMIVGAISSKSRLIAVASGSMLWPQVAWAALPHENLQAVRKQVCWLGLG